MKPPWVQVPVYSAWPVPPKGNGVWELPDGVSEIRGEMDARGPWGIISSYRALAVSLDGRIFGMRSLNKLRENGYNLAGRVRVLGKSFPAFTSSHLFERTDGSLVDVATIVVCRLLERCYGCGHERTPEAAGVGSFACGYGIRCPVCGRFPRPVKER